MSYGEIHPRQIVAVGTEMYRGRRRFVCDNATVEALITTLQGSTYQPWYVMGEYAPRCRQADAQTGFTRGYNIITAEYETARIPGEVKIRPAITSELRKVYREPEDDKRIIEGADPKDTNQWHSYQVVEGDNRVPTPRAHFIIEAATESLNMNDIWDLVGHVNSSTMPAPIGARSQSVMLLGTPVAEWVDAFDLWYLDYLFAYSGPDETWNTLVKSQKGFWAVKEKPVFTADFEVATTMGRKFVVEFAYGSLVWNATEGWMLLPSSPEPRAIAPVSSFNTLPGYPR